jgi:putative radical SAM enzyme (TIGR03279 family)
VTGLPPEETRRGVLVEGVLDGSAAWEAGVRPGDILLTIDGAPVGDIIDYLFAADEPVLTLMLMRDGETITASLAMDEAEDPGLDLEGIEIRTCGNNCVFCFVSQLPRGMRRPLYLKDDDYRMSFLYGNYLTLTNMTGEDRERILRMRLTPLYISVHTTDDALRRVMLGNPRAPAIMEDLRFFARNRIEMHTQIVLCPGYNDGEELSRTVRALATLAPWVASIAVVPVGLTAHRKHELRPVGPDDARRALEAVQALATEFEEAIGDPLVYASDELYIAAGEPFPPVEAYGELAQIENGVGMVPLFLAHADAIELPDEPPVAMRALTFTGTSFHPYLKDFAARLSRAGAQLTAVGIENRFFGPSVTVAGLLTGQDVVEALRPHVPGHDVLLIPDVVLREGSELFLDDLTVGDVGRALGVRTFVIEAHPEGLAEALWGVEEEEE